ncbi:hypothetical protein FXO37_29576 [Capsicum annuum]|nr:hypothetical protein FXO37_29576 [Capsicum annuum]
MGKSLKDIDGMPLPDSAMLSDRGKCLINEELDYNKEDLKEVHDKSFALLNHCQNLAYEAIMASVFNEKGHLLFITGHEDKSVVLLKIHDQMSTLAADQGDEKSSGFGASNPKPSAEDPTVQARGFFQGHADTIEDVQFFPSSYYVTCQDSISPESCLGNFNLKPFYSSFLPMGHSEPFAQFSQMRPIGMESLVAPRMPMYPPGGPSLGVKKDGKGPKNPFKNGLQILNGICDGSCNGPSLAQRFVGLTAAPGPEQGLTALVAMAWAMVHQPDHHNWPGNGSTASVVMVRATVHRFHDGPSACPSLLGSSDSSL